MAEETKPIEAPIYNLKLKVNGEEFECETQDLKESILSFAPRFVKTKVMITITNSSGKKCEKMLFVLKAKMLFRNKTYMNFFLNHLIFK